MDRSIVGKAVWFIEKPIPTIETHVDPIFSHFSPDPISTRPDIPTVGWTL